MAKPPELWRGPGTDLLDVERFPTGVGQTYVIQESTNLAGLWSDNSSILTGSGSAITQVVFSDSAGAFFRVAVSPSAPGAPAVGP